MGNRQKSDSREFRSGIINEEVKPEFCELKPEMGPCTGSFLRYFYNSSIDECLSFYYGGCDGNENNFHTLFACNAICQEPNTTEDDIIFKVSFKKEIKLVYSKSLIDIMRIRINFFQTVNDKSNKYCHTH